MKNHFVTQTGTIAKSTNQKTEISQSLSDDAFYLIALVSQLKKMLGPASQQYLPATGTTVAFTNPNQALG